MTNLTAKQRTALEKARHHFGRFWKFELGWCWAQRKYPPELYDIKDELQRLHNTMGTKGLKQLRL